MSQHTRLPFRVSFSTGSLYHFPLSAVFALAGDLEMDGVELVIGPGCLLRGPDYVGGLSRRYGVPILSLHPPIITLPGWQSLAASLSGLARWATALAIPLVTVHTPGTASLHSEKGQRYLAEVAGLAAALAAGGSQLAVENRASFFRAEPAQCLDDTQSLLAFARSLGAGVTFDTAHAGTLYPDIVAAYGSLAPAVRNIHFSDLFTRSRMPDGYFTSTIWKHHQLPGEGSLPLADLIHRLSQEGYDGLLTLECSPTALRAWSRGSAHRRLTQALAFLRRHGAAQNADEGG